VLRSILPFVGAVAVAYGVLCAWVFFTQRGQIYFPTPVSEAPRAQALWVESQGERIKVWTVARPGGRALLYFGGNAEDVAGNVELFAEAFPDRSSTTGAMAGARGVPPKRGSSPMRSRCSTWCRHDTRTWP
jgi:hypothetical protein